MIKQPDHYRVNNDSGVRDMDFIDYDVAYKDDDIVSHHSLSSSDSDPSESKEGRENVTCRQKEKLEVQQLTKIESQHVKVWRRNAIIALCVLGSLVT
jgi:CCR4-NOT transcriptional regulation complex NOT5 subunit